MNFEGYEFDVSWFPDNFEGEIRERICFDLAFYLRKKYMVDDTGMLDEYDKNDDGVVMFCPTFGDVFEIDPKVVEGAGKCCNANNYLEPVCPNEGSCGATCRLKNAVYKYNNLSRNYNFGFVQQTDRGVVLRVFKCTFDFSGECYQLNRYGDLQTEETVRVFFNKDRTTKIFSRLKKGYSQYGGYFSCVGSSWVKKKKYQSFSDFSLLGGFEGTLLEGFQKYIDMAESIVTDDAMTAVFLLALFKYPVMKYLIKSGFLGIAEELTYSLMDNSGKMSISPLYRKAKNMQQLFGFETSKFNNLSVDVRERLTASSLFALRELNRLGAAIDDKNVLMATNQSFKSLAEMLGDKEMKKVLKFLRGQGKTDLHSCIGDYYDYLLQVKELNLNISDNEVRYPKSLNNAHTRLSALLKYNASVELSANFRKQTSRYEGFCFRQGNLSLRAVRTVSDLKLWAQRFSNCSAGYVERIAEGTSMIFVIVARTKPKKAYYMLEYGPKSKQIIQCRGYSNNTSMNDDPAVKEFCEKWLMFIKEKKPKKSAA